MNTLLQRLLRYHDPLEQERLTLTNQFYRSIIASYALSELPNQGSVRFFLACAALPGKLGERFLNRLVYLYNSFEESKHNTKNNISSHI